MVSLLNDCVVNVRDRRVLVCRNWLIVSVLDSQAENLIPFKRSKSLDQRLRSSIAGGLAQLGERLAGSQKVVGSNPSSSTSRKSLSKAALRFSGVTHFDERKPVHTGLRLST